MSLLLHRTKHFILIWHDGDVMKFYVSNSKRKKKSVVLKSMNLRYLVFFFKNLKKKIFQITIVIFFNNFWDQNFSILFQLHKSKCIDLKSLFEFRFFPYFLWLLQMFQYASEYIITNCTFREKKSKIAHSLLNAQSASKSGIDWAKAKNDKMHFPLCCGTPCIISKRLTPHFCL